MTTAFMRRVSDRVLGNSRLGESMLVYVQGVEHAVRGFSSIVDREVVTDGGTFIQQVHEVRLPISAFTEMPDVRDRVQVGGELLWIVAARAEMSSLVCWLSRVEPR